MKIGESFLGGGVKTMTMTMTMTRGCDDNDNDNAKGVMTNLSDSPSCLRDTFSCLRGFAHTRQQTWAGAHLFNLFSPLTIFTLFCCTLPDECVVLISNADDNLNLPQLSQQSNVSLFMESPHWFSYSNPIHSCGCISSSTFVVSSLNAHNPLVGEASQAVSQQLGFSKEGKAAPLFLAQGRWT